MTKRKKILSIINLKKSYENFLALKQINVHLNSGEFVVLLGPNGAGKSTLFSILSGMLSPDEGDCTIDNYSIKYQTVKALKGIGIVFQQPTIDMELSVIENLIFHARLHGLKIRRIKQTIYDELKNSKLDKKANNKVRTLSGGERRKVELIRALIHKPKILLMDEPTVGLDPQSRKDLLHKVLVLKDESKLTTLWATHLVDEADKADKIIILNNGKIMFFGKPKEIKKNTNAKSLSEAYFNITEQKNDNI